MTSFDIKPEWIKENIENRLVTLIKLKEDLIRRGGKKTVRKWILRNIRYIFFNPKFHYWENGLLQGQLVIVVVEIDELKKIIYGHENIPDYEIIENVKKRKDLPF